MDRDDLIDLFSIVRPCHVETHVQRLRHCGRGREFRNAAEVLRVDEQTAGRFDAEGAKPFQYQTKSRIVIVNSCRHLPERLYDEPDELAIWAREAVGAPQRAKAKKPLKKRKQGKQGRPVAKAAKAGKTAVAKPKTAKRKNP
jgi:DNA transformation protein